MLALAFTILLSNLSFSQGCSDAGFCTIDGFKPHDADSMMSYSNQFKVGTFIGNADHAIAAYGAYFEYNKTVSDKFGFDVKLTTLGQNGNDISTFGASDIFLNAKYGISSKLKVIGGFKIPLMAANKSLDNLPLPMDYQASLGTFDLVFGIGYNVAGIQLVAALQQPLTQNDNQFFSSLYPEDSPLRKFQATNNFIRQGDVLLRVSYPVKLGEKFVFTPSILPIYHLGEDKYTDEMNIERTITGSDGLTLNANLYLDFNISERSALQFNAGFPFIVRESRPDGLTRSSIMTLEYRVKF